MRTNAGVAVVALVAFSTRAGAAFLALPGAVQDRAARAVAKVFDQALETEAVGLAVSAEGGRPWIRVLLEARRRDSGMSVLHAHSLRWEATGQVARIVCAAIAETLRGAEHGTHGSANF